MRDRRKRGFAAVSSLLLLSSPAVAAFMGGGGAPLQAQAAWRGCGGWRRLCAGGGEEVEEDVQAGLRETLAEVAGIGAGEELGSTTAMDDDLRRELEDNAPSGLQMAQDVMGVNAITYVLALLVLVSSIANAVLGGGWLGDAVGGVNNGAASLSNPLPSPRVASFALPPGYAPPPTSELIKTIPDSDLRRFLDGQQ